MQRPSRCGNRLLLSLQSARVFDATAKPLPEHAVCKVRDSEGVGITFCFFGCAQLYFAAL